RLRPTMARTFYNEFRVTASTRFTYIISSCAHTYDPNHKTDLARRMGPGAHHDLFRRRAGHRILSERQERHRRGLLPRWARNDRVDRGLKFSLRQSGLARTDGVGCRGLSIRHS